MSKRMVIGAALCGALVVLVSGGLFASNMGFKLNYQLLRDGTQTGTNPIALPWNRQVGIDDAFDLIQDINTTGTPAGGVARVERWTIDNEIEFYQGIPTDPPAWALDKARGYWVKVDVDVDYVIVGSHDPGFAVTFQGSNVSAASTGTNFYAPPYHSTAADYKDLIDDINANGVPPNQVERILKWDIADNAFVGYQGVATDPQAPPFIPGEALFVKVGTSNVTYNASHY